MADVHFETRRGTHMLRLIRHMMHLLRNRMGRRPTGSRSYPLPLKHTIPKDDAPERPWSTIIHVLPMEIILMIGECLDDASLRNLRVVSRGFDHAMHDLFVQFCVAKVRSEQVRIMLTCPESLLRVSAITEIPEVAQEVLSLLICITIPPIDAAIPFIAQACESYDAENPTEGKGWNFVCDYWESVCAEEYLTTTRSRAYMLSRILDQLVKLRTVKVEVVDVPLPMHRNAHDVMDKILLRGFGQSAGIAVGGAKKAFSEVLSVVSEHTWRTTSLEIHNQANIFPELYCTGSTRIWQKYLGGNMNALRWLTLTVPGWGLKSAYFRKPKDLQGAVIVSDLIRTAPNLEQLKLSGTHYACLNPETVSAVADALRPQKLNTLHLEHFVTTADVMEQLCSSQDSSLRDLRLYKGGMIAGGWVPFLQNVPMQLHLHKTVMGYLYDLHESNFDFIAYPGVRSTLFSPSYTEPLCEECATWTKALIDYRNLRLNTIIRSMAYSRWPYGRHLLPGRPDWQLPTYALQEYACQVFRDYEIASAFRSEEMVKFEGEMLTRAKAKLHELRKWNVF